MAGKNVKCRDCGRRFHTQEARRRHQRDKHGGGVPHDAPAQTVHDADMEPDWEGECENCGASPVVPITGLCGPCTWGEADTMDGNW